jgi:hypothetical protein
MIASVFGPVLLVLLDPRTLGGPSAAQTESKEFNKVADTSPVVPTPQAKPVNSKNVIKSPRLKADEKYLGDNTLGYLDGPPPCAADNSDRREMIERISDLKTRDFEYGTLILDLLSCKSFVNAVDAATKIADLNERDGTLTKIAMSAIEGKSYQAARRAIDKHTSMQVHDLLTSILIGEMNRPAGYDPDATTYATDLIKLSFGSLGGATYDFRTGKTVDWFSPCVRGRASCSPVGSYDFQYFTEPLKK